MRLVQCAAGTCHWAPGRPCYDAPHPACLTLPPLLGCLLHRCLSTQGVLADGDDAEAELALLRDLSNEDDWGLEALTNPGVSTLDRQLRGGRRSLIDELTAAEEGEEDVPGDSSGFSGNVQWGGTAGTTGIDMEEQEAILTRYFRWAPFLTTVQQPAMECVGLATCLAAWSVVA